MDEKIECGFCDGYLGAVEDNSTCNDQEGWSEYRTCMKCGYQWAKTYWDGLKRQMKAKETRYSCNNCGRVGPSERCAYCKAHPEYDPHGERGFPVVSKKFRDKRTGEIVTRFSILEIDNFEEVEA